MLLKPTSTCWWKRFVICCQSLRGIPALPEPLCAISCAFQGAFVWKSLKCAEWSKCCFRHWYFAAAPSLSACPQGGGVRWCCKSCFQFQLPCTASSDWFFLFQWLDWFSPTDEKFGSWNTSSSPCSDSETLLAQAKLHSDLLIWVLPVKLYCEMGNPGNFPARWKDIGLNSYICLKDAKSLELLGEIIQFPASLAPEQLFLVVILIRVFAAHNYQCLFFLLVGLLWPLFEVSNIQGNAGQGCCATRGCQKKASETGCNCGLCFSCCSKGRKSPSCSKITMI